MQILLVRTGLGLLVLYAFSAKKMEYKQPGDRLLMVAAGLCGTFLYYYLENTALTYTSSSNVGVIVAVAPFFIFMAAHLFLHEDKLRTQYFLGFILAFIGIFLMSYSGKTELHLNPLGDFLAVVGIAVWAVYTVLFRIIVKKGYSTILATRTMFFYGFLGMLVLEFISPNKWVVSQLFDARYLVHFLFLGVLASAICFLTWNYGLKVIGPVVSSFYLYLSPVITIIFSVIFLSEVITPLAAVGVVLTLGGLLVSEYKNKKE